MRLIDADKLIKDIEKSMIDNPHTDGKIKMNHTLEHQHFMALTVMQPTAYDVDKVVEQIHGASYPTEEWNVEDLDFNLRMIEETEAVAIVKGVFKDE